MFVFPLGPRLVSITDRCVQIQMLCRWAWPGLDSWEWIEGTSINPSGNPAHESHASQNLCHGNEPPPVPPSQRPEVAKVCVQSTLGALPGRQEATAAPPGDTGTGDTTWMLMLASAMLESSL